MLGIATFVDMASRGVVMTTDRVDITYLWLLQRKELSRRGREIR
jgi:hypothetical protein